MLDAPLLVRPGRGSARLGDQVLALCAKFEKSTPSQRGDFLAGLPPKVLATFKAAMTAYKRRCA